MNEQITITVTIEEADALRSAANSINSTPEEICVKAVRSMMQSAGFRQACSMGSMDITKLGSRILRLLARSKKPIGVSAMSAILKVTKGEIEAELRKHAMINKTVMHLPGTYQSGTMRGTTNRTHLYDIKQDHE